MSIEVLSPKDWTDLLELAEGGDSVAQYEVGLHFESGLTIGNREIAGQNGFEAFAWYVKSHKNGNPDATIRVADFMSDGVYCEKNPELSIELYEQCMQNGSAVAANNLATVYRDKGDFKKAFDLYQLAQKLDKSISLTLALCHYYGIGTTKDQLAAFEIFLHISGNNDYFGNCDYEVDEANYLLGQIYLEGIVVDQSLDKARHYLKLADKDHDHRSAQELLLLIGRGDSPDQQIANSI